MDAVLFQRFIADLERHGATAPPAALAAQQVLAAAGEAVTAPPAGGIREQLTAGSVTPDNVGELVREAALNALVRTGCADVVRDLQVPLARITAQAIRDDAGRIVAELQPRWDEAAEVVTTAAGFFAPDSTADEAVTLGTTAVNAWRNLTAAVATLDGIAAIRSTLGRDFGYDNDKVRSYPPCMFVADAGPSLAALDAVYAGVEQVTMRTQPGPQVGGRWLRLVREGSELRLNTATEATEVLASGLAAEPALVYG